MKWTYGLFKGYFIKTIFSFFPTKWFFDKLSLDNNLFEQVIEPSFQRSDSFFFIFFLFFFLHLHKLFLQNLF